MTFDEALARIRAETDDTTDISHKGSTVRKTARGAAFERLMLDYFRRDSIYSDRFTDVKLWYDWYHEPDTGIDIVARDIDGNLVGIQCKCWADDSTITLDDIATMFTVKDRKKMDRLMLVFTGQTPTANAQKTCEESKIPILMQSDLRGSSFDWGRKRTKPRPKQLMDHQKEAVKSAVDGLKDPADRGKLVMACGTGKTLTALHIAERTVGSGGMVLYLVPSLSLIPQAMREWADNRHLPHQYMAVCSDKSAGSDEQGSITEIPIQPSTKVGDIKDELDKMKKRGGMRVIFSTYNSVERMSEALLRHDKKGRFDLILFDEAHRTTGAEGIKESYYLKAHNDTGVPAKKRLYMTATPRVYAGKGRSDAADRGLEVYSMDDAEKYGEVFYDLPFSKAVERGLLSPYKIVIREVDQGDLYGKFIRAAREQDSDIKDYGDIDLGYMAKIGGICKAITHPDGDHMPPRPLQRVMVFHNTIRKSRIFAGHGMNLDKTKKPLKLDKTTQKTLSFDTVAGRLLGTDGRLAGYKTLTRHVDGSTNSRNRGERIDWLRASDSKPNEIRILSNARCLQEGVDVPALDAVAFMEPRNSPIDIIQSIGRVMRRSDGKEAGYVVIPIPILKGDDPDYVLKKNRRYEQVNRILRAILAHDDELQRMLNMAVLRRTSRSGSHASVDVQEIPESLKEWLSKTIGEGTSDELLAEIRNVILNLGDKSYHSNMGERLGEQAVLIEAILKQRMEVEPETASAIDGLHADLRHIVGVTLTPEQTVRSLAQHAVMSRVFDVMFPDNHNPVAAAFDRVLEKLRVRDQLKEFEAFYLGIRADIARFTEPDAKQDFLRAIYDSFFRGADRKAATKHGIVHTPVEIVNFILDSVQHVLSSEFGRSFDDTTVKVLDPFTGTGIFISQLLERDMISPDMVRDKYMHDIYSSEIMLPAFYVAMSNIEASYQKMSGEYVPFDGISYMDTFAQHPSYRLDPRFREEQARLGDPHLKEARDRTKRQGMESINVIVGNPPYSAGQKSANEDNRNVSHPALERKVADTYVRRAPKGNKVSLYNSYIKALRWASDRIGDSGAIGFIMPSAWITGNAEAGIRACLYEEFTDVYCFDLRGDVKKANWRKEGDKIFGGGSTVGVVIAILVKNPAKTGCSIHYHNIGDYLSREQKLGKVSELKDISHVKWRVIIPDSYHDWLNQRGKLGAEWDELTPMGSKAGKRGETNCVVFGMYSRGLATARDVWVYNSSVDQLVNNMGCHIDYCNKQDPNNFQIDPKQATWNTELSTALKKLPQSPMLDKSKVRIALYRPFFRQYLYFDPTFVAAKYQIPSFYPAGDTANTAIMVPDKIKGEFSVMIAETTPDLHIHEASQAFPLKAKKQNRENVRPVGPNPLTHSQPTRNPLATHSQPRESGDHNSRQDQRRVLSLHNEHNTGSGGGPPRAGVPDYGDGMTDNITDWALERYRATYCDRTIAKEDIFYYTYGVLHSPGFRAKYRNFLVRGIPNIPMAPDFRAFERGGRALAELHLNFEMCPRRGLGEPLSPLPDAPQKIAFGRRKSDDPGPRTVDDQSKLLLEGVVVYDNLPHITYKVNGRTPIGWFVDRYKYTKDNTTGITNYPLEGYTGEQVRAIIERLVYVGVESDRIISSLPEEFEGADVGSDPAGAKPGEGTTQQYVFGKDGLEPDPARLDRYTKAAV